MATLECHAPALECLPMPVLQAWLLSTVCHGLSRAMSLGQRCSLLLIHKATLLLDGVGRHTPHRVRLTKDTATLWVHALQTRSPKPFYRLYQESKTGIGVRTLSWVAPEVGLVVQM